jgi:hypothetical protein
MQLQLNRLLMQPRKPAGVEHQFLCMQQKVMQQLQWLQKQKWTR